MKLPGRSTVAGSLETALLVYGRKGKMSRHGLTQKNKAYKFILNEIKAHIYKDEFMYFQFSSFMDIHLVIYLTILITTIFLSL